MSARSTKVYTTTKSFANLKRDDILNEYKKLNNEQILGPPLNYKQMHIIRSRIKDCIDYGYPIPSWDICYFDVVENNQTSNGSYKITGIRRVPGKPRMRLLKWADTVEPERNIDVHKMTVDQYIKLYPENENEEELRKEYQSLLEDKNRFRVMITEEEEEEEINELPKKTAQKKPKKMSPISRKRPKKTTTLE